jgi:hypothetical protein
MDFGIVLGDINKTIFRCETCIKAHAKTHEEKKMHRTTFVNYVIMAHLSRR